MPVPSLESLPIWLSGATNSPQIAASWSAIRLLAGTPRPERRTSDRRSGAWRSLTWLMRATRRGKAEI